MTKIVRRVKKAQILVITAQNEFLMINYPEACSFVGFKKHKKAKRNILRYRKYVAQIESTTDLKRKIEQQFHVYAFRLTNLYEYDFPPGLTKIQTNLNDFDLPQRPYQYDLYVPHIVLKDTFSDDLKKNFQFY